MADLDTPAKRASGFHVALPWRNQKFPAIISVGQDDRQAMARMYSGILAAAPSDSATAAVLTSLPMTGVM